MIKLKVKVRSDATTFTQVEFLDDEYVLSKSNPHFEKLINKICEASHLETIEEVKITAMFDW